MAAYVIASGAKQSPHHLRQLQLVRQPWRRKAIQVLLALLFFASPIVFVPSALHEEQAGRWVRAGLSRNTVKEVLLPGGATSFLYALVAGEGVYRHQEGGSAAEDGASLAAGDGGTDWQPVDRDLPSKRWPLLRIEVQALAADASNPSIIYVGMGGTGSRDPAQSAGLYASNDGGQTWQNPVKAVAGQEVQAIAIMSQGLAAGRVSRSERGDDYSLAAGDGSSPITASGAGQSPDSVVCAATASGIYCNTGESQSWVRLDWRGTETRVLSLAICPGAPKTVYIGTDGLGPAITQDGGSTWKQPDGDLRYRRVYDIAISPSKPDYIYAATDDGVWKSTDAGLTWTHLAGPTKGRRVNTIALEVSPPLIPTPPKQDAVAPYGPTTNNGVPAAGGEGSVGHGSGGDEATLYVGLQHGAAYRSVDGGRDWVPLKKGLGDLTILSLAVDPQDPSVLWAGTPDGVWCYTQPVVPSETEAEGSPASPTATHTAIASRRDAVAATPTAQPTLTLTQTPPPSATPTATQPPTPTVTFTLRPTATRTPQVSPTRRPSPTPASTATPLPPPVSLPSPPPALPTETRVPR